MSADISAPTKIACLAAIGSFGNDASTRYRPCRWLERLDCNQWSHSVLRTFSERKTRWTMTPGKIAGPLHREVNAVRLQSPSSIGWY